MLPYYVCSQRKLYKTNTTMRNLKNEQRKLSLKKFQIAKIKNPQTIVGGNLGNIDDDDDETGGPITQTRGGNQ